MNDETLIKELEWDEETLKESPEETDSVLDALDDLKVEQTAHLQDALNSLK